MTSIVHALKNLMMKNTGFAAITFDLLYLLVFAAVAMTAAPLDFQTDTLRNSRDARCERFVVGSLSLWEKAARSAGFKGALSNFPYPTGKDELNK